MADKCIFCGKDISFLKCDVLSCGGVNQPVCFACRDRYIEVPLLQRARLALETGRAMEPEAIEDFLKKAEDKAALEARRQEYQKKTLTCCDRRMTEVREVSFVNRAAFFEVCTELMVMFRCDCCGQVKLFEQSFLRYTPAEKQVPIPPEAPGAERATGKPGKKPPWEK